MPGRAGDPIPDWLPGTWTLRSATSRDLASGAVVDILGVDPFGYINYSADGRMMVVIVRRDRRRPAGAVATPAEADTLVRSMVSYAGTYSLRRNEITHHVELSWNEVWTGTDQTRMFRFDGTCLYLDTPPSPSPVDGTMSVRSMTWERAG
jgi:hypothetical protein